MAMELIDCRQIYSQFCRPSCIRRRSRIAGTNLLLTPTLLRPSVQKIGPSFIPAGREMRHFHDRTPLQRPNHESLFSYTSGRWLWDEDQQLRARYRRFNVAELQAVAAETIGSRSCLSIAKLAEGGYNKVFRLCMEDGKTVLARISNSNAGPPFYTTASEVATMAFARDVLQLPVSRVLSYSSDPQNRVGCEYIIMEEAKGDQLALKWEDLEPDSKLSVMRDIVAIEAKMLSISFSKYGSIYFMRDAIPGAVPAVVTSGACSELKERISQTFAIGPSVERGFWKQERSEMESSRGPWSSFEEYALCVGSREIQWITKYAAQKPAAEDNWSSTAVQSPQAHLELLELYQKVAPRLVNIDDTLRQSTLFHTDLHSSNLFVEHGRITSVIDWQGLWAGPIFLLAQSSPLVECPREMLLHRPDNFDQLDAEKQAEVKSKIFRSTLFQLYLLESQEKNSLLTSALQMDHSKTRRLPIELAGSTWEDEIVSFRAALINVEKYWHELGFPGQCPFHFTESELRDHAVDAQAWNDVQDFFDDIDGLVKRDGWTQPDTFEAALDFFTELKQRGLKHLSDEEKLSFEKQTRWLRDRR